MRSTRNALGIAFALVLWLQTGAASAQEAGAIELTTLAHKELRVEAPDGRLEVKLVPAGKVVPGDLVVYTIRARNISERDAERVVITDPIPEHMTYLADSAEAESARIYFSVDGGMRFDRPEALQVTGEDGRLRPAGPRDYTHIRFVLDQPIPPAADRSVRFVARLD